MKYTILMGRGIEGTGNTKYAIELQEYINVSGNQCRTFANKDKKWGREKSHQNNIELISFTKETDTIIKDCETSNKVIILSVPAKNFDKESIEAFMSIVKRAYELNIPTIYIQVDHRIHSINRNFYAIPEYYEFFKYISKVITHSLNGDFVVKFCRKHGIALNDLITASDKLNGINGLDFEKYRHYWKDFNDKEYRTIKFLGRVAAWKGPWLVRELHEKYFKDNGYICTLEGIEMSIQSLQFLYDSWDPVKIVRKDTTLWTAPDYGVKLDNDELEFEHNHTVYMLPPYTNDKAMERMSKQQFGIELLLLDDRFLSDIMEYAMMEIVAVGTVPVFRKHWAEMFKINGKPLIEYGEDTGTIFLDEDNPEEAVKLMNYLSDNEEAYDRYRMNAYEFYKKYLSNSVIFKQLLELM